MIRGSKGSFTPEYFVQKIKERNGENPMRWRMHLRKLAAETRTASSIKRALRSNGVWIDNRTYSHYNTLFSFALSRFLGIKVADLAQGISSIVKKPSVRVLEDGMGAGYFLSEFKPMLEKLGVKAHTVGLHAERKNVRMDRQRGKIDELVRGLAEYYVPKGKFDLVVSLSGSVYYSERHNQADHVLKFASTLNEGGLMLVGISPMGGIIPFRARMVRVRYELWQEGFKTGLYKTPRELPLGFMLPEYVLVAQRESTRVE